MSPFDWYLKALKSGLTFRGRARRKEFWWFVLFQSLLSIALNAAIIGLATVTRMDGFFWLLGLAYPAAIVPIIAAEVRRFHDIGMSGWFALLGPIPLLGLIVIAWMVHDGDLGSNKYGEDPKVEAATPA